MYVDNRLETLISFVGNKDCNREGLKKIHINGNTAEACDGRIAARVVFSNVQGVEEEPSGDVGELLIEPETVKQAFRSTPKQSVQWDAMKNIRISEKDKKYSHIRERQTCRNNGVERC